MASTTLAPSIPAHMRMPIPERTAGWGSSPSKQTTASKTMGTVMAADISAMCLQGCRRMRIQAAIGSTMKTVITKGAALLEGQGEGVVGPLACGAC